MAVVVVVAAVVVVVVAVADAASVDAVVRWTRTAVASSALRPTASVRNDDPIGRPAAGEKD
jgi:hypothetical protein